MSDTEASERARAWSKAEVTEKADIAGFADEDREKAEYEAAEREKAWAKAKAKQKTEIARFVAERVERWSLRQRQESRENTIPQREQRKRPLLISEPLRRPKWQRKIRQMLRQGPRLRLRSRKMWKRRVSQRQRLKLILQRGQGRWPSPSISRRQILPGFLTRLGRKLRRRRG